MNLELALWLVSFGGFLFALVIRPKNPFTRPAPLVLDSAALVKTLRDRKP